MSEKKKSEVPTIDERLARLEENFGQFVYDLAVQNGFPRPVEKFRRPIVPQITDVLLMLAYAAILTYFLLEIRRRYLSGNRGARR
jgi:hypothetical protein